jgi:hypothetical protein
MTNKLLVFSLSLAGLLGAGTLLALGQQSGAKPTMTVYKSPTCGCCSNWITHLERNGFEVKAVNVDDIDAVKRTYGVPAALGSCHTGLVNGYVIEGHIPADAVHRFLREKPAGAIGLAVPGMPAGSPGMEMGNRKDPYNIVRFDKSGQSAVFERR